jgi:aspartyl-tRNA(Asn)/glutamyl-tRNA(Gln) amidotransferase subunit C
VFALVEEMQAVDTSGLAPLAHPILFLRDLAQPLRADAITESDQRTQNMQSAPAEHDGYFLVPRVIE